jgi:serine/threonine-protein kinase
VHRDVKPGNLLVRPDGRVVLTDFGIARAVAADQVTAGAGLLGTAAYLAPEQISGSPVAPATDIYALGVVAYECLTLTRPFAAESPVRVAPMHTRDEPPPLPETVPPQVRHVVMRALAKDPSQRWPSAQAMAVAATDAARDLPDGPWSETPVAAVLPRPAPTAMLPPLEIEPMEIEPRRRTGLWVALAAIAAGFAMIIAATAIVLGSADTPSGAPPASVMPSEGAQGTQQQGTPQQTEVDQPKKTTGNDGGGDGDGRDNSGHGGGGGDGGGTSGPG